MGNQSEYPSFHPFSPRRNKPELTLPILSEIPPLNDFEHMDSDGDEPEATAADATHIVNSAGASDLAIQEDYRLAFREHLVDTREHLSGTLTHNETDSVNTYSFHAPNTYWTPAEKDAFFHGLCIHSRLRPDLIAEDIRTKTLADVCTYLDLLEVASQDHLSDPDKYQRRAEIPIAHEVSDNWVEKEEGLAGQLAVMEDELETETIRRLRESTVYLPRNAAYTEEGKDEGKRQSQLKEFETRHQDASASWAREDLFLHLRIEDLQAMDRLLRMDEENHVSLEDPDDPILPDSTGDADNILIDPVLLTMDRETATPMSALSTTSFSSLSTRGDLSEEMSKQRSVKFNHSSASTPSLASPAPSSHDSPTEGVVDNAQDLTALSPTSRRRYWKRMYMRRKRAEKKGAGLMNEDIKRLKPGRIVTFNTPKVRATTPQDHDSESDRDSEFDGDSVVDHPSTAGQKRKRSSSGPSGKRRDSAFLQKLGDHGVDASSLRDAGFGLFHLVALGKLMRLYKSLSDVPVNSNRFINGKTIAILASHVVCFVMDVALRTIVAREQARALKSHTKVWKVNDNMITSRDVAQALHLKCIDHPDRTTIFSTLLDRFGFVSQELVVDDSDKTYPQAQERSDGSSVPSSELRTPWPISPHRSIFMPIVRVPQTLDCAQVLVESLFPSLGEPSVDELLPEHIDKAALAVELADEEKIDEFDRMLELEVEQMLWGGNEPQFLSEGNNRNGKSNDDEQMSPRIKSKAYIDDSDT